MRQYYASDRKKREQAKKRKQEEKKMKRLALKSARANRAQAGQNPGNNENPPAGAEQISMDHEALLVASSSSELTNGKSGHEKE